MTACPRPDCAPIVLPTVDEVVDIIKEGGFYSDTARVVLGLIAARLPVWRQAAEHVAESLTKGTRVIVQGRLKSRSYDDRDGNKRTVFEVDVEEIGPSLRYATAVVTRATGGGKPAPRQPAGRPPAADPWAGIQQTEAPF